MILSKKIKKYVKEWGIRLTAKIFRLASLSYAPVGFRLKCEPTFATQNGFSHRFPANAKRHPMGAFRVGGGSGIRTHVPVGKRFSRPPRYDRFDIPPYI